MKTTRLLPLSIRCWPALLASLFALWLAGCEPSRERAALAVTEAYVRMPPPGTPMAAGYFHLKNSSDEAFTLRSVSSPEFASVEMHQTIVENGVSKMRSLDRVSVAAGEELIFEPGGRHLMLSEPRADISGKTEIALTLELESTNGTLSTLHARFKLSDSGDDHAGHPH